MKPDPTLDQVARAILSIKPDRTRDKPIPQPSKQDLERKFRMDIQPNGQPVVREVK